QTLKAYGIVSTIAKEKSIPEVQLLKMFLNTLRLVFIRHHSAKIHCHNKTINKKAQQSLSSET
ncbi:MAG TPA: hypothetical protein VLS45_01690, partial [Methylomicrobium sp.]|nr:hypothetical protein [Methylomicrobium sp.]